MDTWKFDESEIINEAWGIVLVERGQDILLVNLGRPSSGVQKGTAFPFRIPSETEVAQFYEATWNPSAELPR